MTCTICGRTFADNERVVPVMRYTRNERRGDFVHSRPSEFIHFTHLAAAVGPA